MRVSKQKGQLRVRAIAGTHVILMALDVTKPARSGLRGFAIKRAVDGGEPQWLTGLKYFPSVVKKPVKGAEYSTHEQPLQSFVWSDYRAEPGKTYEFTVVSLYGDDLANLQAGDTLGFAITTEREDDGKHGIWFNRGIIASHAFEAEFKNKPLTKQMTEDVGKDGKVNDREVRWLSRGLLEACLRLINTTQPGEGLRVCAYEFTYQPLLLALKRALDRGVDVQIIFHDTKQENDANRKAIATAKLPEKKGSKQLLFPRTRTKIPHNKFIVKLVGSNPVKVWTGSTNFTDTGFLGQTNVGHLVTDASVAKTYLDYWHEISADPVHSEAVKETALITPDPPNAVPAGTTPFFSPRRAENMLDWYRQRIEDGVQLVMMTIPFNVADPILEGLQQASDSMRFVILEDPPTEAVRAAEHANRGRLLFSNGALLNKSFLKNPRGGASVAEIPGSKLDQWFVKEELARPTNQGHVFFVHSKVLLIDPLSDDPLVCSGSANFSKGSLISNDENMLLIRGDKRVADIYLTELDRIFRHFYARDVINILSAKGNESNPLELDETPTWVTNNTQPGSFKDNRRQMFFGAAVPAGKGWAAAAKSDPDPFAGGAEHANATQPKKPSGAVSKTKVTKKNLIEKRVAKAGATGKKVTKKKTAKNTIKKKTAKNTIKKKTTAKAKIAKKTTAKKVVKKKSSAPG